MIEVGQQLGGYTILRRIGHGGMGDVFLAQHRRVARRAAVKVLVPELSSKATILERFFNEARATSLIRHPGIVEILDCDVLDGQAFIIMEYLDGESLGAYLHRTGPLVPDLPFLLGAGAAAASAVAAAHATGVIHRDLKPDNIYLHLAAGDDPTVTVKILDFGIAKLLQKDGGQGQTSTGVLLGTPRYMSPEQCRGAGRVDARSDVYSLGCILYEGICGSPPFVREGMGDLILAHVSEAPEPPSARVAGLSADLNSLVLRMLAKDPDERPRSMAEVGKELRECAGSLGITLDQPLRPRVSVERPASVVAPETRQPTTATQIGPTESSGAPSPETLPMGSGPGANAPVRATTPYPVAPPVRAVDQDQLGSAPPVIKAQVGGTEVMEVRKTTTLSSTASEIWTPPPAPPGWRRRSLVVAGGAVAVAATIVAILLQGRPSRRTAVEAEPAAAAPALEPAPGGPAAEGPTSAPPASPASAHAPPADVPLATVNIDVQGVPPHAMVTVDGRPANLPIQLVRGSEVHRILVRPPGAPPRALEVDGTRDRTIQLIFDHLPASAVAAGPDHGGRERPSSDKAIRHRSSTAPPEHSDLRRKPVSHSSDRDAITDI